MAVLVENLTSMWIGVLAILEKVIQHRFPGRGQWPLQHIPAVRPLSCTPVSHQYLFSVTHRDGRQWFLTLNNGASEESTLLQASLFLWFCKQISRATPSTSPECHGEDVFWNTPEQTLHPHSCVVVTATLLVEQLLPLTPAPGSSGIFTTHLFWSLVPAPLHWLFSDYWIFKN